MYRPNVLLLKKHSNGHKYIIGYCCIIKLIVYFQLGTCAIFLEFSKHCEAKAVKLLKPLKQGIWLKKNCLQLSVMGLQ